VTLATPPVDVLVDDVLVEVSRLLNPSVIVTGTLCAARSANAVEIVSIWTVLCRPQNECPEIVWTVG
jgi:hypothetical protein